MAALAPQHSVKLADDFRTSIRSAILVLKQSADKDGRLGNTHVRIASLHVLLGEFNNAVESINEFKREASVVPRGWGRACFVEERLFNALSEAVLQIANFPTGNSDLKSWAKCQLDPGAIGQADGKLFEDWFRSVCVIRDSINQQRKKFVGLEKEESELTDASKGA